MRVKSLSLSSYRNIGAARLDFSDGVNIIYGENAQGKTNILESIWYFSSSKSFRASREKEVIKFGADRSRLSLIYDAYGRENEYEIVIPSEGKKSVSLNGVAIRKSGDMIGNFLSVLFSPSHLTLVKDGAIERRKFMDCALCQLKPKYTELASSYQRTMEQRNAALKQAYITGRSDTLDIWDRKLAVLAGEIIVARCRLVKDIGIFAKEIHNEMSGKGEELNLKYAWPGEFETRNPEDVYHFLISCYERAREDEIREGVTLFGPHRDDMLISISGSDARKYASQGQQRSAVLSLKIAEAELLYKEYGEYPLLLLDDVLSELDPTRQEYIINKIKGKQVILTACETERFESGGKAKTFRIEKGCVADG